MSMYNLYRVMQYGIDISDNWTHYSIRISNDPFAISDEEKKQLDELEKEYDYHPFPNVIFVDRVPSKVAEVIDNPNFIADYEQHLSDKFFVCYLYEVIE